MSLISCPECAHKVSDSAELCPECGFNISKYIIQQNDNKRKLESKNKAIHLKNQRDEYYNEKYKELYNTIEMPSKPTDQLVVYYKHNLAICFAVTIIFLIINGSIPKFV